MILCERTVSVMKKITRILAALLAVVLIISGTSFTSKAASTETHSLSLGKAFTPKFSTKSENHAYKLVLKKESVVSFSFSNSKYSEDITAFLYENKVSDAGLVGEYWCLKGRVTYIGLQKGTYYLTFKDSVFNQNTHAKVTVKTMTAASVNKGANYSIATAQTLNNGKWITIAHTPNTDYNRWYKVTLKKKKKITLIMDSKISHSDFGGDIYMYYGSTGDYIQSSKKEDHKYNVKSVTSKSALPKGTYYIQIKPKIYKTNEKSQKHIAVNGAYTKFKLK